MFFTDEEPGVQRSLLPEGVGFEPGAAERERVSATSISGGSSGSFRNASCRLRTSAQDHPIPGHLQPHTPGSPFQVSLQLILRPLVPGCLIAHTPTHPRSLVWVPPTPPESSPGVPRAWARRRDQRVRGATAFSPSGPHFPICKLAPWEWVAKAEKHSWRSHR